MLVALFALFAATPATAGAITLRAAQSKALKATKAERSRGGIILFGLRAPVRGRSSIRESGRRPPPVGLSTRPMPTVLAVGREPAYFFYLDRGAYQAYEHPGRVVLVGAVSGKVRRSRTLRFGPVINGTTPIFLRSREGYELPAYRVTARDYSVPGAVRAASSGPGPFGSRAESFTRSAASERLVASSLAAENSCTVAIGGSRRSNIETLGSASGAAVLPLLSYDPTSGRSLTSFVTSEAIGRRGCRDILLAIIGDGYRSLSPPTTRTGLATSGSNRMREYHVNLAALRSVIASNPSVTFKLMLDGPGSGAYLDPLKSLANVLLIATSSSAGQTAFRYLPQKIIGGDLRRNPLRLRADSSFLTTQLFGAAAFAASDAEVVHAAAEVAAGRAPSFLAYMIARGFALSRPFDFTADLGATQRLYVRFAVTPPGPINRAPVATPSAVTTTEDTPAAIVLGATDPDGDALTYTVGAPAHGALGGTAPNLTYTPAADYSGTDSFTFSVSDGSLISATVTVSITVTPADDPPVTAASGTLAYTENDPPTTIAPALTVTDIDSATLTGATVRITANHVASDDLLALPAQPAITAVFDAPTGTLTLSGSASIAAYEAALRAVTYANSSDNPGSAPRTVTFTARDAGGYGPAGSRTITITPVNDPPDVDTSAGPLSYTENDPATPIDAGLVLTDPDSQITGATVRITSNHASPEDVLALPAQPGIGSSYDSGTGTLTLTGTASPTAYQVALQAVTYRNTSNTPSTAVRTVTFLASDASSTSAPATRDINVNATDNAPDVDNSAGALAYTENDPATAIDATITIIDPDSANLTGATVQITGNYVQGEDILAFTPAGGVSADPFDALNGRLTLTGTASVAAYEAALEAVTYVNTQDDPSTATRTVTYQARDAGGFGLADTHAITVDAVDDPPVAVNDSATAAEDSGASVVPVLTNDTDVDAGPMTIASASDPANGTVVLTGGSPGAHTGLTYAPDANYCNDPPGTTPDTFAYTLNGGSTATVSVTVTCVDDPPVAVDDTATVAEDAPATAVPVLTNDTDIDGGPMTIASASDPANGTVVLTGGSPGAHTGLTYQPDANYCNTPPGTTPDTFTYTLNGGSTATVSVTVTCDDDPPVAVDDASTVAEDAPATAVAVLANDTDVDGGPMTIASASDPANGTVVLTGGSPGAHTGLTYQPDPNYCNTPPGTTLDTFTYTLNGGDVGTVSVTVTCIDDPPVAVDDSATVGEDAPATAVTVLVNDTDVESDTITIASASDPANGTVVLTGGSPGARTGLTYQPDPNYCNAPPGTTPDTFTYTINGGSTATVSMTVTCVDDPPVAINDSATVLEDASATAVPVLVNDTDIDGGPKTIASATDPANGTVVLTGGSPGAHTGLTYAPDPNYCNSPVGLADTFSYTLNGGSSALVTITVTCVDDAPDAVDDSATVAEDSGPTAVSVLANDTDVDGGTITIASASDPANGTVVLTGGSPGAHTGLTYAPDANYCNTPPGSPLDTFTYTLNGGDVATVSMSVTCVDDPPVAVNDAATVLEDASATAVPVLTNDTDIDGGPKTISSATDPANGTVVLTGGSPGAHTGLTYQPDPNYCNNPPGTTPDTFTYTINGGSTATVSMTVTCVDDPPVAVDDAATVLEDASATAVPVLANDTDIDGGPKTISSASDPANGTVVLTGGSPGAHTGLTYMPDANYCNDPPGTTPDTFTYTLNGGSNATVSMTVTCVNDNPVADDETFNGAQSAIGNTAFIGNDPTDGAPTVAGPKKTITGDILDGDADVDGPGPLVVTAGTFATNDGGTVVIESDGDFTFTPAAGTSCSDTSDFFDYTISDQNTPTAGTDVGRVTIAIANCVWYINNNAPGNAGTSTAPFDTLAQAESASAAGHTIFVFDGDDTTTGLGAGIDLKSNQRLLGEAADLQFGPDLLHTAIAANRPTLTDNNADVVALASNNTVRGIAIDPQGTGGGIAGATGDAGGTIDDVRIIDTGTAGTQPSLELDGTSGTFDVSNLTIDNSAATGTTSGSVGVRLNQAGTVNFASAGTISIRTAGARGLEANGPSTSLGTGSVFDDIMVTGSGTGGVALGTTTGTTTFGDGSGTDLSLQTTSGANAAFLLNNAGSVTVPAAGTANVSATGGPAIDVSNTSGASLPFDDVDSTNSASTGIALSGLGAGTFSANGSSLISNATATDFDLDGGTGAITYDGAITDNTGQLVRVQNTSNGVKDFNGPISGLAGAAGGNVLLASNTGATVRFDGGVKLSSSGATAALGATGGGTLAVTDPASSNNALGTTTSTGQALNVVNTTIHDDDLTFESVRSSTASNGIVLNNTANANGRLVVTGAGGTCSSAANCSGGAIQSSTGAGVALTSVPGGASLTRMAVTSGGDDGIRATTVNDVDLADSIVTNNGNSHAGGAEERGLDYLNVTGTPEILRTTVSGSDDSNAHIRNTVAGATALSVTQSTFSDSKFNTGLRLRGEGASTVNATVTGSVFSLNADPGFSMQTDSVNTAQQTLLFDNNDVSGGSTNAVSNRPQVSINADGASTVKATVTNNDIKSGAGAEVILNTLPSHTGTFDAKVNGNDINDSQPGALDALADGGSAIWGWAHGDGVTRMEIRNNNVSNWGGRGMELSHNDGNGDADYTVTGNVLSTPDVSPNTFEGIYILSGGAAGDASDVCVDMENNDMDGIGRQSISDIALDRFAGNLLRFADFNDTSVPNLQTNLRGKNPASPALTVETFSLAPTATTDTACDLPVGTP